MSAGVKRFILRFSRLITGISRQAVLDLFQTISAMSLRLHVVSPPAPRAYARTSSGPSSPSSPAAARTLPFSPAAKGSAASAAKIASPLASTSKSLSATGTGTGSGTASALQRTSPNPVFGIVASPVHRKRSDGRFFERGERSIDLSRRELGDADVGALIAAFHDEPQTAPHSLFLHRNAIGDAGARELARALSLVRIELPASAAPSPAPTPAPSKRGGGAGGRASVRSTTQRKTPSPAPSAAPFASGSPNGTAGGSPTGSLPTSPSPISPSTASTPPSPSSPASPAAAAPTERGTCQLAHSLVQLSLHSNRIGALGAAALGAALTANRALRSLDLLFNAGIGADGVAALAAALPLNGSLTHLALSWSDAGAEGAAALAAALSHGNRQVLHLLKMPNTFDLHVFDSLYVSSFGVVLDLLGAILL